MPSQTPTSSSIIPWRCRADLQAVPLEFSGRPSWGIKDPLTLAYFELRDEEYFVLRRLDGQSTIEEICDLFRQQFRPANLTPGELQQFIGQLASQGLLVADGPGYGRTLVSRDLQGQSRRRWSRLFNVLCIRFRGFDPDRLFDWMLRRLGWLFSPAMIFASLILFATAIALVVVQFDRVMERLPDTQAILSPPNLIWLPLLMAGVKILHECGHGLTCKRFGGECRELGAMLLVFTPTLYCNVSDMWMVRDKWKRIAVSAAGMWVEAVIASGCTLLWWFSSPGLFHSICLNLMFICGVSTFIFNGNPLLRYDGYFVMADWLEIPNLQQQSSSRIRGWLGWWFCGIRDHSHFDEAFSRKTLLLIYGIASTAYRILLTFLILWSLHLWLQPYGMGMVVQLFAIPTIGAMAIGPLAMTVRFFRSSETRAQINWPRFQFRSVMACAIIGLLLTIPVPNRIVAGALLDQDTAQRVYAALGGTLERRVRIGDRVDAGQEIARLIDPKIDSELIRLEGEVNQHRLRLEQLERRRVRDPEIAALIPTVREAVRDFEAQLSQLRATAERLVLRAPTAGIVLPPALQSSPRPPGSLAFWTGSPLDEQNQGCHVKPGTTICLIGLRDSRSAVLLVSQDDINLVRVGQAARIVWRELADKVFTARIVEIAALDLEFLSRDAVRRLNLPARTTADGSVVPIGTWYLARVQLDPTDAPLLLGAAGQAKILTDPISIGTRTIRWFRRTFSI